MKPLTIEEGVCKVYDEVWGSPCRLDTGTCISFPYVYFELSTLT